ncbi:MAG TPA: sodium:solute symporter, partial [Planctomycetaceae bacterium]|nr:sodium:solute symporter [Planctomycetaceae bacterium]
MTTALGAIDLLVLAASLIAVVVIGLKVSGKTSDLEAYLLGDRNLPWWAILGSIVATETSTATVLSVPGIGYGPVGMRFLQLALGYIIGRTVVVRVLLPLYFRGDLFTAYQVLDQRFGPRTKQAASLLFLITRNLGDGLRLFLAAMVLQQLAGWPFSFSVIVMGVVTMFYTYFGGMRSVVWNDCLQFVIYMVGAIAAVFVIAANIPGGWDELWRFAAEHDKLRIFDFTPSWSSPYNFWAGLIGGAVLTLGTHGTDHMMVQRYLSARSQRDAGKAVFLSGLVVFVQFAIFLFIGVELACYYAGTPKFEKTDQVFADFIVHYFPKNTGLVGLMLAAILAAAMSTLSSSLNSSASALVNDFYLPSLKTPLPPERALAITRYLTLLFGVIQIGVGFWATRLARTVVDNALTIAGFSAGLLLGVYALGVLTKRVGQSAALSGAAVGLAVLLLVQFGVGPIGWKPIAWPWLALVGSATTFGTGLLLSL